jgi:hypothetical protein
MLQPSGLHCDYTLTFLQSALTSTISQGAGDHAWNYFCFSFAYFFMLFICPATSFMLSNAFPLFISLKYSFSFASWLF